MRSHLWLDRRAGDRIKTDINSRRVELKVRQKEARKEAREVDKDRETARLSGLEREMAEALLPWMMI